MNNFTPTQLFAILLRVFAVSVLWNALDIFTYFPSYWMSSDIGHSHAATFYTSLDNLRLYMLYFRFGLHVVVGMYLLARPRALAAKLARGIMAPESP
jgi:hypothetical protein